MSETFLDIFRGRLATIPHEFSIYLIFFFAAFLSSFLSVSLFQRQLQLQLTYKFHFVRLMITDSMSNLLRLNKYNYKLEITIIVE